MSKKKSGRIAIPFLVTIFIGLIIVGGAAIFIYHYFELGKEDELKEPIARTSMSATYEDSHTILFVLDMPKEKCSSTFLLMRSVPKEKKILFVGLPANSIAVIDDRQTSLQQCYERGGVDMAKQFTEQELGIGIDRYMVFDEAAFLKLCDIAGGVTYGVEVDIPGIEMTKDDQYFTGDKILKILTYPLFEDGEEQRAYVTSSLISSMVNQADGKRLATNFDNNFNTIVNMTDTNITSVDYKDKKTGIKYMLSNGSTIARFRVITGTSSTGYFVIDRSFGDEIKKEYFTRPEPTTAGS